MYITSDPLARPPSLILLDWKEEKIKNGPFFPFKCCPTVGYLLMLLEFQHCMWIHFLSNVNFTFSFLFTQDVKTKTEKKLRVSLWVLFLSLDTFILIIILPQKGFTSLQVTSIPALFIMIIVPHNISDSDENKIWRGNISVSLWTLGNALLHSIRTLTILVFLLCYVVSCLEKFSSVSYSALYTERKISQRNLCSFFWIQRNAAKNSAEQQVISLQNYLKKLCICFYRILDIS